MNGEEITINSRKFDGEIHKSWKAKLIDENEEFYTFVGEFGKEISHSDLGVIRRGTVSYEFYWKNKWFNVFRFHEPHGELRNFYCNLNQPPVLKNGILDYIDLDIDVLVWKDFSLQILDVEEFEAHALKFNYSPELQAKIESTLKELLQKIESRVFPFNYKL